MHLLAKSSLNNKFVICQDQQLTSKVQNTNGKNDLAQLAKGVHSLCQNKNAHSLGLKSHLKRLQFHTMFDVCMTVSWIECLFLHKPSTHHLKHFFLTNTIYPHHCNDRVKLSCRYCGVFKFLVIEFLR